MFLVRGPGPAGAHSKRGRSMLGVFKDQQEGHLCLPHFGRKETHSALENLVDCSMLNRYSVNI